MHWRLDFAAPAGRYRPARGCPYHSPIPAKKTTAATRSAKPAKRGASGDAAAAKAAAPGRAGTARPSVRLGAIAANGVAASMYGLIERGVGLRPKIARTTRGTVEFRFREDFARLRVCFAADGVQIDDVLDQDGEHEKPDLVISGSLPDVVQLAAAPLVGGIPKPTNARGRAAIARIANGKVRIEGKPLLARRLLKLLEI